MCLTGLRLRLLLFKEMIWMLQIYCSGNLLPHPLFTLNSLKYWFEFTWHLSIQFQLQVDKNCNATPIVPPQTQPIGAPGSGLNQNVSASLTSNAIRQSADQQHPHIHYINMQKQSQGSAIGSGVTNKVTIWITPTVGYLVIFPYVSW